MTLTRGPETLCRPGKTASSVVARHQVRPDMTRRSPSARLLRSLGAALLLIALGAGSVLGGEVTGSGEGTAGPANANSICVFSGLNDDPDAPLVLDFAIAPNGPGGRTQNWGQLVRVFGVPGNAENNPGASCGGGSNFARER